MCDRIIFDENKLYTKSTCCGGTLFINKKTSTTYQKIFYVKGYSKNFRKKYTLKYGET